MRLTSIKLAGFGSYENLCELDLSKVDVCAVTGENGAGKSTLFDAVLFALYGRVSHFKPLAELHTEGSDKHLLTEVTFTNSQHRHTFKRTRTRSGSTQAIYTGPQGTTRGAKAVTEAAHQIMGANFDILTLTAFSRQDESGRMAAMKPAQLRNTLSAILIGDRFTEAETTTRSAHKSAERNHNRAELVLEQTSSRAAFLDELRERHQSALQEAERLTRIADTLNSQSGASSDLQARINRATDQQKRHQQHTHKIKSLTKKIGQQQQRFSSVSSDLTQLEARLDQEKSNETEAKEAFDNARNLEARAGSAAQGVNERLGLLQRSSSEAECWVCGAHLESHTREALCDDLRGILATQRQARAQLKITASNFNRLRIQTDATRRKIIETERDLSFMEQQLAAWQASLAAAQESLANVGEIEDVNRLRSMLQGHPDPREVKQARLRAQKATSEAGAIGHQLRNAEHAYDMLDGVQFEHDETLETRKGTRLLREALVPSGVPQLALGSFVGRLAASANDVLSALGGLQVQVAHDLKQISLQASDVWSANERAYHTFSGGERMQMDIALRVGLARLAGLGCATYVLDEGWGALDARNTVAMARFLHRLLATGGAESFYTVSHVPSALDSFRWRVEVSRGVNGSEAVLAGG